MKRPLTPRRFVTASDAGGRLLIAATGDLGVDTEARTITGLVVPYGKAGHTSGGRLEFSAGSLRVSDPKRIKLLREHDQTGDVIGHGVSFTDTDKGMVGTFSVPATEAGDRALAEAALGLRDAFSVGVQLDDATLNRLRKAQIGSVTRAAGDLREVSLVSVPAFDDARLGAAAAADLVVSAWTDPTPTSPSASAGNPNNTGGTMFTEAQRRRLAELLAKASRSDDEQTELDQLQQLATAAGVTVTAADHQPATAAGSTTTGQPATATAGNGSTGSGQPAVVPAVAGAAHVTSEPSTYNFATGPSLVHDLYAGRMMGDGEAQQRVEQFNAQLRDGNPASVASFATAAATRDDVDGAGTDLPSFFAPNPNRPELMRSLVDVNRPFISRLDRVPISNAQPFAIPTVGEFTGVGDHTEGTPHRPAGTLTLGGDTVQPKATSGAWEASRELLDAATPALDRIAARAMLRDYQRQTEGKIVALVAAIAATPANVVFGIDTALELRGAMLDFVNDDDEAADLVVIGKAMLRSLGLDVDNSDRPQLPFVGPVNSTGTMRAGYTGVAIDGTEVARSARLDSGVGAGAGVIARKAGILWAESPVLQFRFDEVLGPGVIKLALWAYSGAAILDTADVQVISTGVANAVDADPAT